MLNYKYGIFERNYDDGDSYLVDNWVVERSKELTPPYTSGVVVFEGTLAECQDYLA
jgi:hypothetical protein